MTLLKPLVMRRCLSEGLTCINNGVAFAEKNFLRNPSKFIDDFPRQGFASLISDKPQSIVLEEPYCLKMQDVRVIGFRHIVTEDNWLLSDHFTPPEILLDAIQNHYAPTYEDTDFEVENGAVQSERVEKGDIEIDEPMVLLTSLEPSNYGSFLFRVLPKLITARNHHLDRFQYFVYCPQTAKSFSSLFKLSGVEPDGIKRHNPKLVYHFKELYVPGLRNSQAYLNCETVQFYRQLVAQAGVTQNPQRLLYVSRRIAGTDRSNVRLFINEAELIEELQEIGFEIVEPENLSTIDQIRAFASAKLVLGPSGAGMFNTVFAPSEAMFISIEAFPYWLHAHANLPDSLGQKYAFLVGQPDFDDPVPTHKRWSLDVPQAIERIKQVVESL